MHSFLPASLSQLEPTNIVHACVTLSARGLPGTVKWEMSCFARLGAYIVTLATRPFLVIIVQYSTLFWTFSYIHRTNQNPFSDMAELVAETSQPAAP